MKKEDIQRSIYQKIKNISISRKRPMQELLRYYAMERFLYRLSISHYNKSFFLKGGLLLMVWNPLTYRATIDIDLLAKVKNTLDNLREIVKAICNIKVEQDGIEFDTSGLRLIETQVNDEYKGFAIKLSAILFTAKIPLQIDVGFSDKILPKPIDIHYPVLLDFPPPVLKGYTPETAIAEKLHAIMKLGLANTRMKDFYDIWIIINQLKINSQQLESVIKRVFENRKTIIRGMPAAFSEAFYTNPQTIERWNAFIKGIDQAPVSLAQVVIDLKQYFLPWLRDKQSVDQSSKN